jgi:hypothetical protein
MPEPFDLVGLETISTGVSTFADAGQRYVHVPKLRLPNGCAPQETAALICMDPRDNYPTRLFLLSQISTTARALNWNMSVAIAGQTWHSFSWKDVPSSSRPVEVLIGHLAAFIP